MWADDTGGRKKGFHKENVENGLRQQEGNRKHLLSAVWSFSCLNEFTGNMTEQCALLASSPLQRPVGLHTAVK